MTCSIVNRNRWIPFGVVTLAAGIGIAGASAAHAQHFVEPYDVDADTALYYLFNEEEGSYSTAPNDYFIVDEAGNQNLRTVDWGNPDVSPFIGVEGPQGLGTAATLVGNTPAGDVRVTSGEGNFDAANTLDLSTFTIEAWIRDPAGGGGLFSVRRHGTTVGAPEMQFRVWGSSQDDGALSLFIDGDFYDSDVEHAWDEDVWYHVAVTYDEGDVNFYVTPETEVRPNGNADLHASLTDVPSFAGFGEDYTMEIGARAASGVVNLDGDVAMLRYSNTVRESFNLVVPEPGSLALLGAGAGLMLIRRRRS